MPFMMKQKKSNKWDKVKSIASINMPVEDAYTGKYVGIAFLNFVSYWKKGNRAPSRKQLQINVKIGDSYYRMLPHFYDIVKLMSRQSEKSRLNNRSGSKFKIHDKKTWNFWLKFKEIQEEKLRKKKK